MGLSCDQGGGTGLFWVARVGKGMGRGAHSVQSFLMDRLHSQVRWSCLSSSVKKDLLW